MKIEEGTKVVGFELRTTDSWKCILEVEGENCEKELGMMVAPGLIVGKRPIVVIDNVRYGA